MLVKVNNRRHGSHKRKKTFTIRKGSMKTWWLDLFNVEVRTNVFNASKFCHSFLFHLKHEYFVECCLFITWISQFKKWKISFKKLEGFHHVGSHVGSQFFELSLKRSCRSMVSWLKIWVFHFLDFISAYCVFSSSTATVSVVRDPENVFLMN